MKYDFIAIERKWQAWWEQQRTFRAINPGEQGFDPGQPKFYVLDMFPYPSGVGLHVGHPLGYIATDIVARYKRMKGFNVLHPMGYDAFGLPAEQFAFDHGVHPRETTEQNIANMTRQLKRLGLSYDWDRCFSTTDSDYYKWTQWIFLQLFNSWFDPGQKRARPIKELENLLSNGEYAVGPNGELVSVPMSGALEAIGGVPGGGRKWHELSNDERADVLNMHRLAYMDEIPVNWCPALGTVLANEEVTNEGRSERGNHPVYKRPLRQWMLRITAYVERLLADLELVDWPEPIKLMQRNWIGRSEGARVDFELQSDADEGEVITVFTTRPDTLFGATYMVLAPEHPLVETITTAEQRAEVQAYQRLASQRSDVDRMAEAKSKTGVFTGAYAVNPVNGEQIPVWIADYVMMGYGTGAIMAVPAHDERDFAFAKTFGLPARAVVLPPDEWLRREAQKLPERAGGSLACDNEAIERLRQDYLATPTALPEAFTGEGVGVQSANAEVSLHDLPTPEAKRVITAWLTKKELGQAQVQYKLRDWLFSRQRYWGEPFPILHGPDGQVVALDEWELPVVLPAMDDFRPAAGDDPLAAPQPPLARAPDDWKFVEREGVRYTREFNTMPQWAGSCWYFLRFLDPGNDERLVSEEAERYWMLSRKRAKGQGPRAEQTLTSSDLGPRPSALGPSFHAGGVDLYIGGAEHAVLHLLYARFWHKVLYDLGYVSTPEPFGRLFNQGYIQAAAYTDARGVYVAAEEVEEKDGRYFHKGQEVRREFGKMGKSLKNAVSPDAMCETYGCDALRLYEMYLGPLDQSKAWRTNDVVGQQRFLQRVWRNFVDEETGGLRVCAEPATPELRKLLHKTIRKVTQDMDRLSFNTAIAALIELNNALVSLPRLPREVAEPLVLLLSPLAPHVAEELWQRLGHADTLAREPWPAFKEALLIEETVEYPVQVNGKLRARVMVAADADAATVERIVLADATVQQSLGGKAIRKVIVVPHKMVNVVVG